ncbi:MAG: hypothetical protein H7Z11_08145 [Verrucomicrobia bacterium]|nr:hypothetical protein [Leptolyngbya sp. ES-bin-22]
MVQDFTAFRKISFQTVDVEVALAEIEYQYLKFICEATLRNSDEVLREQIRHLHIAGLPSFDDWRKQGVAQGLLLPPIETNTIPTTAIESNDDAVETTVEPSTPAVSDRTSSKASAAKAATKQSSATGKLLKFLSSPAAAKLTSRMVIEQQHELLTAMLKEGNSYDDLAEILTSNGAKISASTLRNYLSAARRLAKAGKSNASKTVDAMSDDAMSDAIAAEPAPDGVADISVEPAIVNESESPTMETATEPTPAPAKPKRGRPKAAAKTQFERETSVKPGRPRKSSSLETVPAPKRHKHRG